jgi:hypothetical protein
LACPVILPIQKTTNPEYVPVLSKVIINYENSLCHE